MKKEDCVIGAEVYTCDGLEYRYTIASLPDANGMVRIRNSRGDEDNFDIEEVHLYDPEEIKKIAANYQEKIDAAKSAFEVAFKALTELHRLENKSSVSHYDLEHLKLIDVDKLVRTIENGGWSSSSLWC